MSAYAAERQPRREPHIAAPAPAQAEKKPVSQQPKPKAPEEPYTSFLLAEKGDYFSAELEYMIDALAPAFPRVAFVRAEGPEFGRFTSQYMVRTLQVLL